MLVFSELRESEAQLRLSEPDIGFVDEGEDAASEACDDTLRCVTKGSAFVQTQFSSNQILSRIFFIFDPVNYQHLE